MRIVTELGNTYLDLRDNYGKIINEQIVIYAKCLSGDSFVKTPSGNIKLKKIKKNEFDVLSYNFEKFKIEVDNATKIDSGKKEIFEIETYSGKKIQTSKNHIFFTKSGRKIIEKRLVDLNINDEVFVYG